MIFKINLIFNEIPLTKGRRPVQRGEVLQGVPRLVQGVPRLVQGVARLVHGVPRLVQGVHRLVQGMPRMVHGVPRLVQGVPRLVQGVRMKGVPRLLQGAPGCCRGRSAACSSFSRGRGCAIHVPRAVFCRIRFFVTAVKLCAVMLLLVSRLPAQVS